MATRFLPVPMDDLPSGFSDVELSWLWYGYLAPVHVTLLTSQWKAGKTTLLTGLLQRLGDGQPLLGREVKPGKALVVSEEATDHWSCRLRTMPLGPNVDLLARPFRTKPTFDQWIELIDFAYERVAAKSLDLFVVDPLASFLPDRRENDAASLLEAIQPLHRLTMAGAAVLLLHHPKKGKSLEGHSARGSGALLGFVDIAVELHKFSTLASDAHRRRLVGLSRRSETPPTLAYQWSPETGVFTAITDPFEDRYRENWPTLLKVLTEIKKAVTPEVCFQNWPATSEPPAAKLLAQWLHRAYVQKKIRREGRGVKSDPFRYRLEEENDKYWDRGELPPMPEWRFD